MAEQKSSFKGTIGFVLTAAGSAVGLGNIWRFPYLAARDGGGLFLVIYVIFALTFGFTLLTTEIAIGRKTRKSPLTAYREVKKGFGWIGILACIVPFLVVPYYCTIGGWVLKYFVVYVTGHGNDAPTGGYFTEFVTSAKEPVIYMAIFTVICAFVILLGVNGGIENLSKIVMPVLVLLVIGIAIFSLTVSDVNELGKKVTGMDGLKVYLLPNLEGMTVKRVFYIAMDALGQLFYSLSVAMGIMIAYGSYVPNDSNLVKAIGRIEIFDTLIAFLAGVMIVPAVYVFMGDGMSEQGPALMFVSLPKVFSKMGAVGNVVGALFFGMVLFAAITSAISMFEAVVSSLIDKFGMKRWKATLIEISISLIVGFFVCAGYDSLFFDILLPNGSHAQLLDVMDYVSNQMVIPVVAISTCILIGWVKGADYVIAEITKNGESFRREKMYRIMIKYVSPVLVLILFLMALGLF